MDRKWHNENPDCAAEAYASFDDIDGVAIMAIGKHAGAPFAQLRPIDAYHLAVDIVEWLKTSANLDAFMLRSRLRELGLNMLDV